jgi:hypothetical protein
MRAVILSVLLLAVSAGTAVADVVHLKNGGRVEGTVTDLGDALLVKSRFGSVTIDKSEVLAIEAKPTLAELYEARREKTDLEDPDALVELGKWCRENGWEQQAKKEFEAALEIEPDHRGARYALGHMFYEGAWRTEREIMEMRGLVLYEGQWVTPEEVAALKALEAERMRVRALERKLNRLFRRLAGESAKGRERAHDDLVTLARELGNEELEKFAGDAKAYYDQAWDIIHSQKVILEIRAQMSNLKRPIPTFQTSLGAGSTPVSIQLPELSVASVGTTVVVPAGR